MGFSEKYGLITLCIMLGCIAIAKSADIRCYTGTINTYSIYTLDKPEGLLASSTYNAGNKTVFYVFGYNNKATDQSVKQIVEAYLKKGANVCILNWEKEASGGLLGSLTMSLTAIPNAISIGKLFGKSLVKLFNAGLNLSNVHLIGFSLGAPLIGYAGREVQDKGNVVGRLTGLDPLGPFFEGLISFKELSSADGTFVDIIHTNPNGLGIDESTGMVDIWANCGVRVQPGCEGNDFGLFSDQNKCSQNRSWMYFVEAMDRPTAFEARQATGCDAWRAGSGSNRTVYLGEDIDLQARGVFYLQTNSLSQYGRGEEGSQFAN